MAIAITLQEYLDSSEVEYDLIPHPYSSNSNETAKLSQVSAEHVAKAVLMEDSFGDYILAVIPSTHRVDIDSLNKQLNIRLGLATKSEVNEVFNDCKHGAVPALAQAYGIPMIVDNSLSSHSDIYFEGGSHTDLVHLDGGDFDNLMRDRQHGSFSHHV